jgi:hypothetical protein
MNVEPSNGEMQAVTSSLTAAASRTSLIRNQAQRFVTLGGIQLLSRVMKVPRLTLGTCHRDRESRIFAESTQKNSVGT